MRKSKILGAYVTPDVYEFVHEAAKRRKLSVSKYLQSLIDKERHAPEREHMARFTRSFKSVDGVMTDMTPPEGHPDDYIAPGHEKMFERKP